MSLEEEHCLVRRSPHPNYPRAELNPQIQSLCQLLRTCFRVFVSMSPQLGLTLFRESKWKVKGPLEIESERFLPPTV